MEQRITSLKAIKVNKDMTGEENKLRYECKA